MTATSPRTDPATRFWRYVDTSGGHSACWPWRGAVSSHGYGNFGLPGPTTVSAHRFAYEDIIGLIPEGLTLDHLCRVRNGVNPAHLEPVTHRENVLRGVSPAALNASKTECNSGHEFTIENTYTDRLGKRHCRLCRRATDHRRYERNPGRRMAHRRARAAREAS